MSKIKKIKAREILNSKGNWTVEAEVETEQGIFSASVPSGTSVGKYEAVAVTPEKAVENVEKIIAPKLQGKEIKELSSLKEIDQILIDLDGTENKSKLGANAILAVSIACLRAGAATQNLPLYFYLSKLTGGDPLQTLPRPCFNVLEGGVHAGNELDIQEFMIVPVSGTCLTPGVEIYHQLKNILEKKFGPQATNVGDEGGFAPPLKKTREALDLITKAIKKAGYERKAKIGLDCAASEFFQNGKYNFEGKKLTGEELLKFYQEVIRDYPILFLEDPFSQEDWDSWKRFGVFYNSVRSSQIIEKGFFMVGDDLTVTNPKRIKMAKEKNICNGIILKPNQIGTVSETLQAAKLAKEFGWKIIVSHRSGDTCDDFIADLAVGIGADFIKAGAPARGERVAKYNRLLRIEEKLTLP